MDTFYDALKRELAEREKQGLLKAERLISSPQGPEIRVEGIDFPVVNFCANNYLGLANHPRVLDSVRRALDVYGYGLSSVRFICGTQTIHRQLEARLADFLDVEDCLLYNSCFDANTGLFENLLGENDAVISARLNHASIIDGLRLAKAGRFLYRGDDPADFERALAEAGKEGRRLAATDGVFSMEGTLAPLDKLAPLCRKHGAILMVDDSHAVGFIGKNGAGTPEHFGVRADILTGTLGKALGGACGGYTAGRRELIAWLRNTSRPYLFSNSLPPALVAGAMAALEIVSGDEGAELRARLRENTDYFCRSMKEAGFELPSTGHPIVPVITGDALLAQRLARELFREGIYVVAFSHPVVPPGAARIRVQVSALHTRAHLDRAVEAFARKGGELGLISGRLPAPLRKRLEAKPAGKLPQTMRAWVYRNKPLPDGGHLELATLPVPRPYPGELLLKVLKVSVCGTDEDLFRGKFSEIHDGIVPGHEIFGEIAALGSNVRGFRVGQKVAVESHYRLPGYLEEGIIGLWGPRILDGGYLKPLNGGYAEYLAVPTYCAHPLPRNLTGNPGFFPSMLEGVGNDCLIARYLMDQNLMGQVAVIGCGPHGLFAQMFARHFGVRRLAAFEIDPRRLALAREFGADEAFDSADPDLDRRVGEFTGGKGFDAVIDIAGGKQQVLDLALKYTRHGGTMILFGLYPDESFQLAGRPVNEIIFSMRRFDLALPDKKISVQGITGREGVWEYLIDAVAVSREMQVKIMKPVTVMGPLENLGPDNLRLDGRRIMKRAYTAFKAC